MKVSAVAIGLLILLFPGIAFTQTCSSGGPPVGTAFANHIINWSGTGDLFFTVTGAPPNVCGALATIRNGSCLYTPGWICTDGSGSVTRGPWRWVDQPNDQTDTNIHFDWPNGTSTYFTTNHYWDKTCPTPTVTTSPNNPPPASFAGTGDDGNWGAGFGNWTSVKLQYLNNSTGRYWNPATGAYDAVTPPDIPGGISGPGHIGPGTSDSVSYHINWNAGTMVPDAESHAAFNSYTWTATLKETESACASSAQITFRVPGCLHSINNPCP